MSLPIFSINTAQKFTFILLLFTSVFPVSALSASCGLIPSKFPLYSDDKIEIDDDITINGINVGEGEYSSDSAIGGDGISYTESQSLSGLDPSSFPPNISGSEVEEITSSTTFNDTTESYYKKIEIKNSGINVNFIGGGPFHIEELKVEAKNVTLNFDAGTYYIDKITLDEKDVTINITNPAVIIHIGSEFKIDGKDANINTSGNVDDFVVYLHSGAKFESGEKNLDFTGFIYGPNAGGVKIEGKDSTIHGAIIVEGEIKIEDKNISVIYTPEDQIAIGNISTCENGGGGGGGDTAATNFNCVEIGANGITGRLYTKTTNQIFSFDIVALKDASTIETSFASGTDHSVTVELVNAETAASCESYPALVPAISQSLSITASDSGTKASANMASSKAYSKVKCRVTDATVSPSIIGCSTDSFSIRPLSFSSITSSMDNPSSGPGTTARAGEDSFSISAETATVGYNGVPKYNNDLKDHNDAVQSSKLSGAFSAADKNTGEATGLNFKYDEVGLLKFLTNDIYDDNFSNGSNDIDNGDCTDDFSNTVVGGKVGCKFANASAITIGRFIPHHFVISEKDLINRSDSSCSPASNFTYTGEKFQVSFRLTAENKSNNTTENYTGSYAKLDNSNIAEFNFGAIDTAAPTELTASLNPFSSSGAWTNGEAIITASMELERNSPNGPFETFQLGIAPEDSDDVSLILYNADGTPLTFYNLDTTVPSDGNDRELVATTKIRFGRLNIENAHGSELMVLPVPVNTEYYNGTSYITNTDDSCTTIAVSQLGFNGGTNPITVSSGNSTASIANSPSDQGKAGLSLSAPGANNTGYIDIISDTFITSFPWLSYDWDGDGAHDDAPSARATFGIYKGNDKQIYFREVY